MEIIEVDYQKFDEVMKPFHIYGMGAFNNLNKDRCDQVFYLLFREAKFRLGFIGGIRNLELKSPFSAPFGGVSYISSNVKLEHLDNAIKQLNSWATAKCLSSISITLPPSFYDSSFIAKQVNCLMRAGFEISTIELNQSLYLENIKGNYLDYISHNGRRNLRIALNSGLEFKICQDNSEKKLAYNIILSNRIFHGYPLRISWSQLLETIDLISAEFFLVLIDKKIPIAAAIAFDTSPNVVQIIYWGDLDGYSSLRPMNYLSSKIFEYYKSSNKSIVDIGYSTENSIPNYGLFEFKESIGCNVDPKFTFTKKLN